MWLVYVKRDQLGAFSSHTNPSLNLAPRVLLFSSCYTCPLLYHYVLVSAFLISAAIMQRDYRKRVAVLQKSEKSMKIFRQMMTIFTGGGYTNKQLLRILFGLENVRGRWSVNSLVRIWNRNLKFLPSPRTFSSPIFHYKLENQTPIVTSCPTFLSSFFLTVALNSQKEGEVKIELFFKSFLCVKITYKEFFIKSFFISPSHFLEFNCLFFY